MKANILFTPEQIEWYHAWQQTRSELGGGTGMNYEDEEIAWGMFNVLLKTLNVHFD